MRLEVKDAGRLAALICTGVSLAAALLFFLLLLLFGSYGWVARVGGFLWIFGLSMIILMPTGMPWMRERLRERTKEP